MNPPPDAATAVQAAATTQASIDAYHLAMLVCAGLLVLGSLVSFFGLREPVAKAAAPAPPTNPA